MQAKEFRLGIYVLKGEKWITVDEDCLEVLMAVRDYYSYTPIVLTKELAKDLGFDITDMGDFWEFNKEDFQLIQIKSPITGKDMVPFYIVHSKKSKHIKVPYVHRLQNLYYEIKNKELTINKQ